MTKLELVYAECCGNCRFMAWESRFDDGNCSCGYFKEEHAVTLCCKMFAKTGLESEVMQTVEV